MAEANNDVAARIQVHRGPHRALGGRARVREVDPVSPVEPDAELHIARGPDLRLTAAEDLFEADAIEHPRARMADGVSSSHRNATNRLRSSWASSISVRTGGATFSPGRTSYCSSSFSAFFHIDSVTAPSSVIGPVAEGMGNGTRVRTRTGVVSCAAAGPASAADIDRAQTSEAYEWRMRPLI